MAEKLLIKYAPEKRNNNNNNNNVSSSQSKGKLQSEHEQTPDIKARQFI
jgi:hypothetical protein